MLSITIVSSLGSAPCFHSLKINPVSGLHLLGVRLRDGYFEPWLLKDDPLGGLRAVNVPSKTDCARKGITFLMAHKELHHTSEEEQRLSLGRWRSREYMKEELRLYLIGAVNHSFCQPVWNCNPNGGICLHPKDYHDIVQP